MNKDELPELPHRAGCATKLGSMYLCNCGQPLRQALREIEQLRDALAAMQAGEPVAWMRNNADENHLQFMNEKL